MKIYSYIKLTFIRVLLVMQYSKLIVFMPFNTLNKLAFQAIYSNLPTIKATCEKDKIILLKAVAIMNNRSSISLV